MIFISCPQSGLNSTAKQLISRTTTRRVCYSLGGDSVTLIGRVEFVADKELQSKIWDDFDRSFFPKGIGDPKFRLIKFHTLEATFWIGGKFRTCKYK